MLPAHQVETFFHDPDQLLAVGGVGGIAGALQAVRGFFRAVGGHHPA